MRLYQQYYQEMIDTHKELFAKFQEIHDLYVLNPKLHQVEFNDVGKQVVEILREYERKLCANSEKGVYAKFSSKLSEKLWDLARKDFRKIDFVGATIS